MTKAWEQGTSPLTARLEAGLCHSDNFSGSGLLREDDNACIS